LAEAEDYTLSTSEEKGELRVCGQRKREGKSKRKRKRKRDFYLRNTKMTAA
jgi:hypothetical protein